MYAVESLAGGTNVVCYRHKHRYNPGRVTRIGDGECWVCVKQEAAVDRLLELLHRGE